MDMRFLALLGLATLLWAVAPAYAQDAGAQAPPAQAAPVGDGQQSAPEGTPAPETAPAPEAQPMSAKLRIAVGETYDFEYDAPPGRATLWLEVRTSGGKWQSQARVTVK